LGRPNPLRWKSLGDTRITDTCARHDLSDNERSVNVLKAIRGKGITVLNMYCEVRGGIKPLSKKSIFDPLFFSTQVHKIKDYSYST
jgi:hypothetical protein